MHIKILGSGCANCHTLAARAREAVTNLGLDAEIEAVTDYPTIVGYGVMTTPALVVDERVVLSGRVPTTDQVAHLLTDR
ncbi:MAG: thioredoxin family protein [Dactylosporangium sp.]|nr:TM0996/MTH895 family glutaredoxin-like protein [Dactylosporangium sp.]NNJ63058.1 thioredoxin family protein [Dactylosporangium sp.]